MKRWLNGDGGIGEEKERGGERLNIGGEMRVGRWNRRLREPDAGSADGTEGSIFLLCLLPAFLGPEVKEQIRCNGRRSFLWVYIVDQKFKIANVSRRDFFVKEYHL